MAWGKSTKQRRAMAARRGRNGDYKRRFLRRVSTKIGAVERHMNRTLAHIVWDLGGFTPGDLAGWLP